MNSTSFAANVQMLDKAPPGFTADVATVNGQPAIVCYVEGEPYTVLSLDIADGLIQGIYIVVNPDKLQHIPRME